MGFLKKQFCVRVHIGGILVRSPENLVCGLRVSKKTKILVQAGIPYDWRPLCCLITFADVVGSLALYPAPGRIE